ncbi:MAG: YraN family protein [Alphaproteobacteria bacterium]
MTRPVPSRGRRNYDHGRTAEFLCRLALRLKGYQILAARYRTPLGEIDIIAARGGTVAVIEVKARTSRDRAAAALHPQQQARLHRAAHYLLSQRPELAHATLRFDLMLVAPRRWPEHIVAAWSEITS